MSAMIGITANGASFLLSLGLVGAVLVNRIVMAEPFVMKTVWAFLLRKISSFQRLLQSSSGGGHRPGKRPEPLCPQQYDRNFCIPRL